MSAPATADRPRRGRPPGPGRKPLIRPDPEDVKSAMQALVKADPWRKNDEILQALRADELLDPDDKEAEKRVRDQIDKYKARIKKECEVAAAKAAASARPATPPAPVRVTKPVVVTTSAVPEPLDYKRFTSDLDAVVEFMRGYDGLGRFEDRVMATLRMANRVGGEEHLFLLMTHARKAHDALCGVLAAPRGRAAALPSSPPPAGVAGPDAPESYSLTDGLPAAVDEPGE
jgi:hypothetical protein